MMQCNDEDVCDATGDYVNLQEFFFATVGFPPSVRSKFSSKWQFQEESSNMISRFHTSEAHW